MEKVIPISLKLNFTPNTLSGFGLMYENESGDTNAREEWVIRKTKTRNMKVGFSGNDSQNCAAEFKEKLKLKCFPE